MPVAYDALLLVSFGGPEGQDDVLPFLENVTRGRSVPRERLLEVAERYRQFGGVSPINAQNRALIAALRDEFGRHGVPLPIYWGNRNSQPYLSDTLREMAQAGVRRALAFVTSAYSSYSSCRQYLEDIARARAAVGPDAPEVDKLRPFFNHPLFVAANVDAVAAQLSKIPPPQRSATKILFSAHSLPLSMAEACQYEAQLRETCRLVGQRLAHDPWELVFQSRSGPASQPWLEPDVRDVLRRLSAEGNVRDVIVSPIGFVTDHFEVVYDLDTEARAVAAEVGLNMLRAAAAGTHPDFVTMIRQLVEERLSGSPTRLSIGSLGPCPDACPPDCCPPRSDAGGRKPDSGGLR